MKTTTGQKLKIGIFTAIGLLILFAFVFLIGSQKNMFSSTYRLHGIFKNVGGLQVGNNARLAGINVGVVEAITILTDTAVRVDITINSKYQKFIKMHLNKKVFKRSVNIERYSFIHNSGVNYCLFWL